MFQLHFELMGFAVVALVAAFSLRRSAWAAAVWLPLLVAASWGSWRVLAVAGAYNGPGMEALGSMFALLFGWPWFVILLAALFAYPRKWRIVPTIVGGVAAVGMVTASYYSSTDSLTVQVIGMEGEPAAASFVKSAERDRIKEANQRVATDASGRITFRYDPQAMTRFEEIDGLQFSVQDARKIDPRTPEGLVRVQAWWPGVLRPHTTYLVPATEAVPVFLKSGKVLVSPALQDFIRERLRAVKEGSLTDFDSLSGLCANPESFALISEIEAIIPAQPGARSAAIRALESVAEELRDIYEFERRIDNAGLITRLNEKERNFHSAICAWAEVGSAATGTETAPQVYARLRSCADELLAASRPYWGEEDSSVNVVENLGELGSRALADFPSELANAKPRGRRMMLLALETRHKRPEDVEWAMSSDDPDLVAAAYDGLQDGLDREQSRRAAERMERLNAAEMSVRARMQFDYLLPAFRERAANTGR